MAARELVISASSVKILCIWNQKLAYHSYLTLQANKARDTADKMQCLHKFAYKMNKQKRSKIDHS